MPKVNINAPKPDDQVRLEVSWRPNNDEHSPNTPGHVQVVTSNQGETDGLPTHGWFATLDEAGIDRTIGALQKAKRAAFGGDKVDTSKEQ